MGTSKYKGVFVLLRKDQNIPFSIHDQILWTGVNHALSVWVIKALRDKTLDFSPSLNGLFTLGQSNPSWVLHLYMAGKGLSKRNNECRILNDEARSTLTLEIQHSVFNISTPFVFAPLGKNGLKSRGLGAMNLSASV